MVYYLNFRLDVKKNVYISKKTNMSAEPYYQISAIITINKNKIHYYSGYSAQKSAWFNSAEDARKGDGSRTVGIHRGCYAKKGTRIVQFSEVNRALDLISATLLTLSIKQEEMTKETVVEALDKALGKTARRRKRGCEATIEQTNDSSQQKEENVFWELADLYCMDTSVSGDRNKSRVNAINHFRRFEQYRGEKITFPICNARLLTEFHAYLNNDDGENDPTSHPCNRARKKNHNTVSKIMACVKQFFRWSRKQYGVTDYGNIMDYSVPTPRYGDPVILTQEEKRQLWNTEFDDETLEFTRDLFYFQCSIGCRVSDFFKLKYENLVEEEAQTCIYYCPHKTKDVTGVSCRIPLSQNALTIFEKYRIEDATPQMPLFHFPKHAQTYNEQLKRLFKEAGLNRKVTVYDSYNQMQIKPLYEVAMSRFARSCFIDVLVGKGVTDNIISTMSGHIPGSKAFHRYHNRKKAQQQDMAIAMLD